MQLGIISLFLIRNGGGGYLIAHILKITNNLDTELRRLVQLMDIKDVRTMFTALEFVQVFQILFDEAHSVRLVRSAGLFNALLTL